MASIIKKYHEQYSKYAAPVVVDIILACTLLGNDQ